jgi:hypothetical protein
MTGKKGMTGKKRYALVIPTAPLVIPAALLVIPAKAGIQTKKTGFRIKSGMTAEQSHC